MKLKTTLLGKTYLFRDVKDVLAKANEEKTGDKLAGLAAETAQERIAAKVVLSEMLLEDLREHPAVPYESDEVTRIIQDDLNRAQYEKIRRWTVSQLRDCRSTPSALNSSCSSFLPRVTVPGVCRRFSGSTTVKHHRAGKIAFLSGVCPASAFHWFSKRMLKNGNERFTEKFSALKRCARYPSWFTLLLCVQFNVKGPAPPDF